MQSHLLKISKALSDETRMNIVKFLLGGEKCVCEVILYVKKAQPTVSLQLKKLELMGLIKSRKNGKQVLYSIVDDKLKEIFDLFN